MILCIKGIFALKDGKSRVDKQIM